MEYQALYRKYRPQSFGEIVGQDHVTSTLRREVVEEKVSHAYLFAGPRGTGKTTTARVLAKSLNCMDRGADGEPCNKCSSCLGITEGSSLDVIELDAASHNKVEDIREIRVNVGTVASVSGARRVYILDEAHMLSRAASNALLKTLEEPPEHVHFVLATTEPYKLLDTVRSRSQRFDFHPIGVETLGDYLATIAEREGFTAAPDGLTAISHHARGSVRDGMGLLEQVAALGSGTVDSEGVSAALGLVGAEAFERLSEAIVGQDARAGLELVAEIAARGSDLRRFVADALAYYRGVFLAHYAPNLEEIVDESADRIERWRTTARVMPAADVIQAIDQLSGALIQLREGREERLVVELSVIRLTRHDTAVDPVSLAARLDRIEGRLRREGGTAPAGQPASAAQPTPAVAAPVPEAKPATPKPAALKPADAPFEKPPVAEPEVAAPAAPMKDEMPDADLSMQAVQSVWPALIGKVREAVGPRRYALLKEAAPGSVEGNKLFLHVPAHLTFHLESLKEDQALREVVEMAASDLLGGRVRVIYEAGPESGGKSSGVQNPLPESPPRAPAPGDLVGEAEGGIDPTKLVEDLLGGEVVDDGNSSSS
ncbi:MAG: DNA polymerase III subunit gamma/tau [Acidimicrobiia bacterium]|nr:DNA polymerase III subunit gamma/tau [Acidimicrobiia bacterium]